MAKTSNITVTNSAFFAVTTSIATKSVNIAEDPSVAAWPTTDFLIAAPTNAATPAQRPSGTSFTFNCPGAYWPSGTIVGYVKNVTTASTTFQQYEEGL